MGTEYGSKIDAEVKKIRAQREAQRSIAEWSYHQQYDYLLQPGVEKGMSFDDYSRQTGCPEPLRERYEDLLDERRVAERQKNDPFLKGFMGQGG